MLGKNRSILGLLLCINVALADTFDIVVNGTASHKVPSTLFGLMFEDINQSGDGGLYGELLQNRAFQQVTPGTSASLLGWTALSGSTIAVVKSTAPVSTALPNSLSLTVPSGAGTVGFTNRGFWGLNVNSAWTYKASFFFRFPNPPSTAVKGTFTIGLSSASGTTFGSTTASFTTSDKWTKVSVRLRPTSSANSTVNNFVVSLNGAALAGQNVEFAMFSLFPPTFKNRANGMRADIAQTLADMKPSFFRFPGGNNLEGGNAASRWQWNNTVGSLLQRPGRQGDWGYVNTDGLGLLEFMEWCEDVEMVPIMAVWSGYSLDDKAIAEPDLQPYIQQAIDQINFVIGDPATSAPAALRASLGRTAPFALQYIEVGNEEFIGHSSSTYASYRWRDFVGNLSAVFPQLTYIATSNNGKSGPTLTPSPQSLDLHVYQTPTWFAQNTNYYDTVARNGIIYFEGEYAAISTNSSNIFGSVAQGRLTFPTIAAAVGEAAFMTGLERNSDIVFAASYAPLLQNVANSQWSPNLVSYNANTVVKSTSYYIQKIFSLNKGETYLPSTLPPTTAGTVSWSVVQQASTNQVFIKITNMASATNTLNFQLPFSTINPAGTGTLLAGSPTTMNTDTAPDTVAPTEFSFAAAQSFTYNAPANSFTLLTISTST